jgi:hypothetical protein
MGRIPLTKRPVQIWSIIQSLGHGVFPFGLPLSLAFEGNNAILSPAGYRYDEQIALAVWILKQKMAWSNPATSREGKMARQKRL